MSWLARLKNEKAPGTHATKATKPGFVGFVACPHGPSQKIEAIAGACVTDAETGAKNQNAPSADATKATKPGFVGFVGFVAPAPGASQKFESEAQTHPAPELPAPDPRLSWSHYTPATTAEIARMAARTEAFERMGLAPDEADLAVDRLHQRDREGLRDMHLCVECARLRADATGWRCGAIRAPIPSDWATRQLQRCAAFLRLEPATNPQPR
jgi:hypothetical protein